MIKRYVLLGLISVLMACNPNEKEYPEFDDPCSELDYFDKEMNDLYDEIMDKHKDQIQFIKNFKQAQIMWTQYRNSMTQAYMDQFRRPRNYSQSQKYCRCKKMAELTRTRLEELKPFIQEMDEIPACWNK
jgi:uncharacterized protein YecT (DUF1311 family)